MDAIKYLKEKARMIGADRDHACNFHCEECQLKKENNGTGAFCTVVEIVHPEKTVEIVEKWSKEHPRKTYLEDLMEKYPNVLLNERGLPVQMCPYGLGYKKDPCFDGITGTAICDEQTCFDCWNTPMEG